MKAWCAAAIGGLALASLCATAQAQAPTKAQQEALRANCRSDFISNCSSVTPGTRAALECLMQNKAKVSAGCQGALNAISVPAPAAAKPEPKPEPKATPKPEPAPAAAAPVAPPPQAPAAAAPAEPAKEPSSKRKATPKKTVATPARPVPPAVPAPTVPAAVPPQAPAAAMAVPGPTQPRLGEAILIRRFCTTDFRVLCQGVQLGQGRAIRCLASNAAALSPGCRAAMIRTGELRQ